MPALRIRCAVFSRRLLWCRSSVVFSKHEAHALHMPAHRICCAVFSSSILEDAENSFCRQSISSRRLSSAPMRSLSISLYFASRPACCSRALSEAEPTRSQSLSAIGPSITALFTARLPTTLRHRILLRSLTIPTSTCGSRAGVRVSLSPPALVTLFSTTSTITLPR
jgi:hypothetical protein